MHVNLIRIFIVPLFKQSLVYRDVVFLLSSSHYFYLMLFGNHGTIFEIINFISLGYLIFTHGISPTSMPHKISSFWSLPPFLYKHLKSRLIANRSQ